MEAQISKDDVITPHLFAEESFTIITFPFSNRPCRAPAVKKMFAPSTMRGELGVPVESRNSCQFSSWIVFGRPPAGTKTSDLILLCIELRIRTPSSLPTRCRLPFGLSLLGAKCPIGSASRKRRMSSEWSSPVGSSATPEPSATPTTQTFFPWSRKRIRIKFPATSPSGPPVILMVYGCSRGSTPVSLSASSRNTAMPSDVTPYSL
mmetsp:Transcript_27998/g.73864  ORF Transcript_27998/g.73864 Transcript_27998/m.73864 type:complete len:206 (-) Transcript_27998:2017-2634(-)